MKRRLAIALAFLAGLYWFFEFYWHQFDLTGIGIPFREDLTNYRDMGYRVLVAIGVGAMGLGLFNIISVHGKNIVRRRKGWYNSAVLFVALILMLIFGFWNFYGKAEPDKIFDAGKMRNQLPGLAAGAGGVEIREITRDEYTSRIPRIKQVRDALGYFGSPSRGAPQEYGRWLAQRPVVEKLFERKGLVDGLLEVRFDEGGGSITFPVKTGSEGTGWSPDNCQSFEMEAISLPTDIEDFYHDMAEFVARYDVQKQESAEVGWRRRRIAEHQKENAANDRDPFFMDSLLSAQADGLRKDQIVPLEQVLGEGKLSPPAREKAAILRDKIEGVVKQMEELGKPLVEMDKARDENVKKLTELLGTLRLQGVHERSEALRAGLAGTPPQAAAADKTFDDLMNYLGENRDQFAFAGGWSRFHARLEVLLKTDISHLGDLQGRKEDEQAGKLASRTAQKLAGLAQDVRLRSIEDLRLRILHTSSMSSPYADEMEKYLEDLGEAVRTATALVVPDGSREAVARGIEELTADFRKVEERKKGLIEYVANKRERIVELSEMAVNCVAEKNAFDRRHAVSYPKEKIEADSEVGVTLHYRDADGAEQTRTLRQRFFAGRGSLVVRFNAEDLVEKEGVNLNGITAVTLSSKMPLTLYLDDAKMVKKDRKFLVGKIWTKVLFFGLLNALGATMFSLLAFFIISASYRAFRIRSTEAALLMAVAFVVMLGQIPAGTSIWGDIGEVKQWLLEYVNAAAQRAVGFGVAVASFAISLRIWLGMEKGMY